MAAHTKRGPPRIAIRDGPFKYVVSTGKDASQPKLLPIPPQRQLYDLKAEPLERMNLATTWPEVATAIEKSLRKAIAELGVPVEFGIPEVIDSNLVERLKSLGYVGD